VGNLGVITVCLVELISFPDTHINGEWLPLIDLIRVIWLAIAADKVFQEGIWAGGVIRRIRHPQDCFIAALREARCFTKLRVLQLVLQKRQEVFPPRLIVLEGEAEAFHRTALPSLLLKLQGALLFLFCGAWHGCSVESGGLSAWLDDQRRVFRRGLELVKCLVAGGSLALLHLLGDMRGHMAGDLLGHSG